jgi:hypothetical protein
MEQRGAVHRRVETADAAGPVKEVVVAGDREAGIVEREGGVPDFGVGDEFRAPFYLLIEKARVPAVEEIEGRGIGVAVPGEQAFRLLLVCGKR